MKITLHLEGSKEEIAAQVSEFIESLGMGVAESSSEETPKHKMGRSRKKDQPAPDLEEGMDDLESDSDDDEGSIDDLEDDSELEDGEGVDDLEDDDLEDDDEEIEEDDEPAKVSPKQLAELKKALNNYAFKNGRPETLKILHKYAKVSPDVKASDFPKIMKELKI